MIEHPWLAICGGRLDRAIAGVVILWQSLWNIGPNANEEALKLEIAAEQRRVKLLSFTDADNPSLPEFITSYSLLDLVRSLLADTVPSTDLEYLALRALRQINGVTCRPDAAHWIYRCTEKLSEMIDRDDPTSPFLPTLLIEAIDSTLWPDARKLSERDALTASTYLSFLKAVGCVVPCDAPGEIKVDHLPFPDWLLGKLFGMPTQIPGFDALFAGTGLKLVDAVPGLEFPNSGIGGRTTLVCGPFGSGKSTLTLEIALEVARKGGMALIVAMEQSVEECLFSLEALGVSTRSPWFDIVEDPSGAIPLVVGPYEGKGAVVFTRIQSRPPHSQSRTHHADPPQPQDEPQHLTDLLSKRFAWMQQYPLRLLMIDPVDAFGGELTNGHRTQRTHLFEEAKARGINLWFTEERHPERRADTHFTENLADTVIEIGVHRTTQGSRRRTIEVTKSRLQREQPGQHALIVQPGRGVRIYPSSQSLSHGPVEVRKDKPQWIEFGAGLDKILGPHSLQRGDMIALQGAAGAARTFIGIQFLLGEDSGWSSFHGSSSLLISDAHQGKMRSVVGLTISQMAADLRVKDAESIHFLSLAPGWPEPGQVLEEVATRIESASRTRPIDRALITNIARWEATMPLMAGDAAFAASLINIFRRYEVTCVFIIPRIGRAASSALTEQIRSNADCLIEFDNAEFRGEQRRFLRITQTHDMGHRKGSFEVIYGEHGVHIQSSQALIRHDPAGTITPVPIRLFLHSETERQVAYNDRFVQSIRATLSASTIHNKISNYAPELLGLSDVSAIDELHIVQLDEFQVPRTEEEARMWDVSPSRLSMNRVARLARRVGQGRKGAHIAVPFYENISLLAWDSNRVTDFPSERDLNGWSTLADMVDEWEQEHTNGQSFFACPPSYPGERESYNCLFFEILMALQGGPKGTMQDWLVGEGVVEAALLFRRLCYRFHRLTCGGVNSKFGADDGPAVWHVWYNELVEFLRECTPARRTHFKVQALFGPMTIAGEWYLAIPRYSAAEEIGWQVIDLMTSQQAEISRMCDGVGLPTHAAFYGGEGAATVMPFFGLSGRQVADLVANAFERSALPDYRRLSPVLDTMLRRMLDIPAETSKDKLHTERQRVSTVVDDLRSSLRILASPDPS